MAFESIENAHFRAKNANRVIASAHICIWRKLLAILKALFLQKFMVVALKKLFEWNFMLF